MGYCINYIWPSRGRCKLWSARLWSKAEYCLYSIAGRWLSGTQSCGLAVWQADEFCFVLFVCLFLVVVVLGFVLFVCCFCCCFFLGVGLGWWYKTSDWGLAQTVDVRAEPSTGPACSADGPIVKDSGFLTFFFFFYFLRLHRPNGIYPMENSGCFPLGKPAATKSRYPTYSACWVSGCVSVSIIHWTWTWTTGSLTRTQMLMYVIAHGGIWTP